MITSLLLITLGLAMLAYGADKFVDGALAMSSILNLPSFIVGVVIVGFATSAPEVLVSAIAALNGYPTLSIGNAIGSNIANVGLVLGVTAAFFPIVVQKSTLRSEYMLMFTALLISVFLLLDEELTAFDGFILLSSLVLILCITIRRHIRDPGHVENFEQDEQKTVRPNLLSTVFYFLFGLTLLLIGSEVLVDGSIAIARLFGASDAFIGLTIVAVGTSLPELAASLMSAIKKETDMIVGNIFGSNIFNSLAVIAMPGIISPFSFSNDLLMRDVSVMCLITIILAFLIMWGKTNSNEFKLSRFSGLLLVASFFSYQGVLISGQFN